MSAHKTALQRSPTERSYRHRVALQQADARRWKPGWLVLPEWPTWCRPSLPLGQTTTTTERTAP